MDLKRKVELIKTAIASLTRHDDAAEGEWIDSVATVEAYLERERQDALRRRKPSRPWWRFGS